MEKLSVTTAIFGLLAVGRKAIDQLWDLNCPARRDTAILNQVLQETKQCRSTIHVLYKTLSLLESGRLPFPERGAWIEADDLIATLTDTVLAFSDLQTVCNAMEARMATTDLTPVAVCAEFHNRLSSLCARIRWHNLSMTMMMTILKCPGEADAQNSRLGLERRMTRLLTSNTQLSNRMRSLVDVFDARGIRTINGESLPYYTPPARGQTSLPTPSSSPSPPLRPTPDDQSFTDTLGGVTRNRSWSPLSGYTLSDIPVLSIISLPVTTNELRDGNMFYTFEFARKVSDDLEQLVQTSPGPTQASMPASPGRISPPNGPSETHVKVAKATRGKGLVERIGLNITARKRSTKTNDR